MVGQPCVWALGDCAAVPQPDGITSPPTAQHAVRQAKTCAANILAALRGTAPKRFAFTGLGKLASLGHRSAVAEVFGIKLRGTVAWLVWRAIYLAKFPGLDRKLRVFTDWFWDLFLPRDITEVRIFRPDAVVREHFHVGRERLRRRATSATRCTWWSPARRRSCATATAPSPRSSRETCSARWR